MPVVRDVILAKLEITEESQASLQENPWESFSYRYVQTEEDGSSSIYRFGLDGEEAVYIASAETDALGEETSVEYYRALDEEEEEVVVALADGEDVGEVDEDTQAFFELTLEKARGESFAMTKALTSAAKGLLDQIGLWEEQVEAQYEEEDAEPEEGDLYLELAGETYFETATTFGFGISYAFGEIESIDEGEDEELVIELSDPEEGAFAVAFTLYEDGIFYPTSAVSRDQFQMSLDYEFNFGNPLGEEE